MRDFQWLAHEIREASYCIGNGRFFEIEILLRRIENVSTVNTLKQYAKQLNDIGSNTESRQLKSVIDRLATVIKAGLDQYNTNRKLELENRLAPRSIPCKAAPMIKHNWLQCKTQEDVVSVERSVSGKGRHLGQDVHKPTDNHGVWDCRREAGYVGNARTRRRRRGKGRINIPNVGLVPTK
jgi:hypothetical protein